MQAATPLDAKLRILFNQPTSTANTTVYNIHWPVKTLDKNIGNMVNVAQFEIAHGDILDDFLSIF